MSNTKFQFTPLREGRLTYRNFLPRNRYFNSRPSARGDCRVACTPPADRISIHAPPRGATAHGQRGVFALLISIHAPPRGATTSQTRKVIDYEISIHAPPRGATLVVLAKINWLLVFQFTPLREGRHAVPSTITPARGFQFTPLREGRRQKICNFCKSFVQPLQISMA